MTDVRAQIATTLKRHQFWHANHSSIGSEAHCLCGLRPRDQSEWADHAVLMLLALPNIAIVELPEDDEDGEWWGEQGWFVGPGGKEPTIHAHLGRSQLRPGAARHFAAALLAAANTAEQAAK